jgi:hypothetical protein
MDAGHSTIAAAALLLWLPIALIVFAKCRNLSQALIWSFLAAQLLLPANTSIKLPMLPQIDKATIASFGALVGCLLFARGRLVRGSIKFGATEILILGLVAGPIVTSELNTDDVVIGARFLPGVGLHDALSSAESGLIALLPFFLARRFLRDAEDTTIIHRALAIAGVIYCVPLLFEVRFSPQLHYWVYGYYPTEFAQTMRDGGFRPMVFMGHGLLAAFFIMTSFLAAISLWLRRTMIGHLPTFAPSAILTLMLLVFKSLGALVYGIAGGAIVFFGKPRTIFRVSVLLVSIAIAYPLLRSADLVPTQQIVRFIEAVDYDRAHSLEFRFENEDGLLERAFQRPVFGWGRYGRSRVYDPGSGKDLSVTDGRWIVDIGGFGLVGFIAEFGLLALCVLKAAQTFPLTKSPAEQLSLATLALILALNIFDLLPNASLIPLTWLFAGSLLGQAERLLAAKRSRSTGHSANVAKSGVPVRIGSAPPTRLRRPKIRLHDGQRKIS